MKKICYIPIDDRPVCKKRVELLGRASGFDIITPPLDLVKTVLDHQPLTSDGLTSGNVKKIKEWFINLKHKEIDAYVIALDQILSGGLVNSRTFDNISLEESIKYLDEYLDIIVGDKPVILIDSIVRLACTAGYKGYAYEEYHGFRNYALHDRKVLDYPFTSKDIFDNYEKDVNSNFINYNEYSLTRKMVDDYLNTRKRKLLITDYLVNKLEKFSNIYYMIGIDDSNPSNTIQSNEINYFRKHISDKKLNDKALVFTGIDELGLMAISRLSKHFYSKEDLRINLHYIGGMENIPGDTYDNGTIKEGVDFHLEAMDLKNCIYNDKSDIDVVMLTYKEDEDGSQNSTIEEAMNLVNKLLDNKKFVILMDFSSWNKYGKLEEKLIEEKRMMQILAYSNWNTIANITGIALAQGISRYFYIKNNEKDKEASLAYLYLSAFSYIKDISYKIFGQNGIKKEINKVLKDGSLNFYELINSINIDKLTKKYMEDDNYNKASALKIIDILKNNEFICSCKNNIEYDVCKNIRILKYSYPWYRTFEMDIDLEVEIN